MTDVHYSAAAVPSTRASGSRGVVGNSALNLLAQLVLAVMALVAARFLFPALGAAQFGVLTLAWTAIGYFSVFDLALGRALTHAVATGSARQNNAEMRDDVWSGLLLLVALGLIGGAALALATPSLVHVLKIPDALRADSRTTFYLLAIALPFTIVTSGLRGIIEGFQHFGTANLLRLPIGVLTYGAPLFVLLFTNELVPIVAVLAAGRIVACFMHAWVCVRKYAFLKHSSRIDRGRAARLVRFGGWMTVSNVVSPLMVNLDRFLIGALLPVAAVGYYVMPYEAVTKLWLIPTAVMAALFPAMAASFIGNDSWRTALLVDRGIRAMLIGVFPLTLAFVALGHVGLTLWLGARFANESTHVLQWLAAGVLINCVGQVAFAAVQAIGRPDVTGKLHILELPFYAMVVWLLATRFGLVGVAMAWVVRVSVDTACLLAIVCTHLPESRRDIERASAVLVVLVAALGVTAAIPSLAVRAALLTVVFMVCPMLAWHKLARAEERLALQRWFTRKAS